MTKILIKRGSDVTPDELAHTGSYLQEQVKRGAKYVAIGGKFGGVIDWYNGTLAEYYGKLVYQQANFELADNLKSA